MSQRTAVPTVPAGWYPDPTGSATSRWWDGSAWTEHLQREPSPVPTEVAAPEVPEPVHVSEPVATTTVSMRPIRPRFLPWSTRSGWALATLPVWSTALSLAIVLVAGDAVPAWTGVVVTVVVLAVALVLVLDDRRTLLDAGHRSTPAVWWFLLTPLAYLIARASTLHRITGRGWAPVVVWTAGNAAPALLVVLLALAVI